VLARVKATLAALGASRPPFGEAVEPLATRGDSTCSREELALPAYALPVRHRTRPVGEDQLRVVATNTPLDPIERREREVFVRKLQDELVRAVAALDGDDRLVLEMRYRDRQTDLEGVFAGSAA